MPHHSEDKLNDNSITISIDNSNNNLISTTSVAPISITTGYTYCVICENTINVDEGYRISYICKECKSDINELKFIIKNKKKLPRGWNCNVRRFNHR